MSYNVKQETFTIGYYAKGHPKTSVEACFGVV